MISRSIETNSTTPPLDCAAQQTVLPRRIYLPTAHSDPGPMAPQREERGGNSPRHVVSPFLSGFFIFPKHFSFSNASTPPLPLTGNRAALPSALPADFSQVRCVVAHVSLPQVLLLRRVGCSCPLRRQACSGGVEWILRVANGQSASARLFLRHEWFSPNLLLGHAG